MDKLEEKKRIEVVSFERLFSKQFFKVRLRCL